MREDKSGGFLPSLEPLLSAKTVREPLLATRMPDGRSLIATEEKYFLRDRRRIPAR
jgi:hypothetical protein